METNWMNNCETKNNKKQSRIEEIKGWSSSQPDLQMAHLPVTQNTVVYLFDVQKTVLLLLLTIKKTLFASSKQEKPNKPNQDYQKQPLITAALNFLKFQELELPITSGGRVNVMKTRHNSRKKIFQWLKPETNQWSGKWHNS